MSHQFLDISKHLELWDESIEIYRDSFPEWEREDEAVILKNIKANSYKMFAYKEDEEIVGFYILDINTTLDYTLFSFLAIKESHRGQGLGSKLVLHAVEYFHSSIKCDWLFIEAEERQAKLYARLGFKPLNIDYRVPAFNSQKSIKMSLMLIEEKSIDSLSLHPIIKDIFIRGYGLKENDIRLINQLKSVEN
ncbi:GNAT family N-acetyltransferase, partial [Sulfurimonas sp. SAG-AH-194-L11]